jgi:hypothetical protein
MLFCPSWPIDLSRGSRKHSIARQVITVTACAVRGSPWIHDDRHLSCL